MKRLLLGTLLLAAGPLRAQSNRPIIQFTGLVVSGDSLIGVPDVEIRVPQTRRHTLTAANGYFSLPVLAGDSVEVRAPASTTHLRIPRDYPRASYSLLVQLQLDSQPASTRPLPASFSRRFLELKPPPPLTVETPPISAKTLLPPKYDRRGRKLN